LGFLPIKYYLPDDVSSLQSLGMFDGQTQSSVTLGLCFVAVSLIAAPLGGWLFDWEAKRRWVSFLAMVYFFSFFVKVTGQNDIHKMFVLTL
jgi:hypothetical protein